MLCLPQLNVQLQRKIRMERVDMIGNINDLMNLYQQLRSNPMQMLSQRFNLPQNMNNPNDIVQHLLNTGQITQNQVNQVISLRNNPMIQQIIGKK